jgi:predicted ATPase
MNAKHITEILIENFRGFQRLELKGLQAVNLIVGENNVGKTSLLEALALVADPKSVQQMAGRLRANAGNVDKRFFRWLLRDAPDIEGGKLSALIGRTRNQVEIYRKHPSRGVPGMQHLYQGPSLSVFSNSGHTELRVRQVSVQHRAPNDLVPNFGNAVRRREGEDLVHQILQAVDPRISRVRVDPVEEGNIISVDIGLTESIPLSQAGQGIYRLVALLSDLIGDTPQVCIIDEIENGLHHTVLKQVWRGLSEISRRLGVQIFATTHSRECLEAAESVFHDEDATNEKDFAVIQLMRVKDHIEGRVLDEKRVEAAIENQIELR